MRRADVYILPLSVELIGTWHFGIEYLSCDCNEPWVGDPGAIVPVGYFAELISTDSLETQCNFATATRAPFPLIGDVDGSISRAYDVLWPLIQVPQRVTYVVSNAQLIEAVFRHEIDIKAHRNDVLRFVNTKFQSLRRGR